jgi:D-alanyl-D-alanine carboxypeptidase
MRQNQVFKIRNEVKRHRSLPYVLLAGALILAVLAVVGVHSSFTGGPSPAETADLSGAGEGSGPAGGLPLGGGPENTSPAQSSSLPASPTQKAKSKPDNPYAGEAWFADPDGLLVVVDRVVALSSKYEPEDLVSLAGHGVPARPDTWKARRVIVDDLKAMFAAGKEAGFDYYVFSAYRSYAAQVSLYQYWVRQLGQKEADRSSARAGHSEHQLGTTLDISADGLKGNVFDVFGESPAGRWLAANAWRFGFVMSYAADTEETTGYEYEPWHFRYVGREVAALIHDKGMIPSVFIRELDALRRAPDGTSP